MEATKPSLGSSPFDDLIARQRQPENAEFDITAMIDLVFMMNIYFLVTFLGVAANELGLPYAQHCAPLDADTAVVFSVVRASDGESVVIYLGDGKEGEAISDLREQEELIASAIERGAADGKTAVLIKAEKTVSLGEMHRLARAAASEGLKMHVSVMEKDAPP